MQTTYPKIIQGGMGTGVSNWRLAQAVSRLGQLGVVSGTALDQVLARRLQDGDPGGEMRRALGHFPFPAMAKRVLDEFFIEGGKPADRPYKRAVLPALVNPREVAELIVVSNFTEIWLARQGHSNPVGINYLEKIQMPLLPSIYGALLAGVDYVLVGAGIPLRLPGVLDSLSRHEPAAYPLNVAGAKPEDDTMMRFDPREFIEGEAPAITRPKFLAIIASNTLAITMVKKANGRVDGFVIEGPIAGGHNAPPRGKLVVDDEGEPVYGERDVVDLAKIRELGLPFWLAGGFASPEKLREALDAGAAGIQVGTAFALCAESGITEQYKRQILTGEGRVVTDIRASPTGFPFKVTSVPGTNSEADVYEARPRICDLGYLREAYRREDGTVDYRCASEPFTTFVAKGGDPAESEGRKCLCNGLLANIGHPQVRANGYLEVGLLTAGNDLTRLLPGLEPGYSAADVVGLLLAD